MTHKKHEAQDKHEKKQNSEAAEETMQNEAEKAEGSAAEAEEASGKPAEKAEEKAQEGSELKDLQKELANMKERYFRALADYQNLQRRSQKEQLEARGRGVEDFVKKLLPVLDTLEKAIEQIGKCNVDSKVMEGLEMFSIQFTDVLEKEGLKPILAKGEKFDPNYHEAMCKRSVDEQDDETVLTVFEKGYTFKDRVIRTAKVEINQK